jgi:hypothetical protein
MTYAAHTTGFQPCVARASSAAAPLAPARTGLLTRLFGSLASIRAREAERTAAAYLARTGYRFTDSIERDLNDRLLGGGGWNAGG